MTREQALALAAARLRQRENVAAKVAGDPITQGAKGFAEELPWWKQAAAGYGAAAPSAWRGVKQAAGIGDQQALQKDIDEARRLEAPLMKTGGGITGNIAGNAALFAPTAAIPGVNTYTGAAALGATLGALAPIHTGGSRGANTILGGAAGIGGQALGRGIGRIIRPVRESADDAYRGLVEAAGREKIPLSAGQATGSRPLQVTESVMENLPLTSRSQLGFREAQSKAFTAAALRRAGIEGSEAAPDVLANQRAMLGNQMRGIAEKNKLNFYDRQTGKTLISSLDDILNEAEKRGKEAGAPIRNMVMNIVAEMDAKGQMAGRNYQAWRQTLRPLAHGGGENAHLYGQLRSALDKAFNEQIATTGGAEAWKGVNRQYANLKTIMDAAGGPGTQPALGQLVPAQLAGALGRSVGREGKALGRGDLNELTRVGQTFVRDQIPNSGTAQRMLIQSLLTGGGGAGLGAGIGAGGAAAGGQDWKQGAKTGAMVGAGVGAAGLLGPAGVQKLMNSPAGQAYLMRGMVPLSEAGRAALTNALRTGALGATPMLAP